ncbi:MAG: response regulator [Cyanobacteria bacterium J06641_5]
METLKKYLLKDKIGWLYEAKFTGTLGVQSKSNLSWSLYFSRGNLVWISGGSHPNRSTLRRFRKHCPAVNRRFLRIQGASNFECPNYYALVTLLQAQQITLEQLQSLTIGKLADDLLDIQQQQSFGQLAYKCDEQPVKLLQKLGVRASLIAINSEEIFKNAFSLWSAWQEQGHASRSPNLAPTIAQEERLKQSVSEGAYHNLVRLVDGDRTLRDLAFQMDQEVGRLTNSLNPYIEAGYIDLLEVPDFQNGIVPPPDSPQVQEGPQTPSSVSTGTSTGNRKPLIGCVDDSPQIRKVMQLILTNAGYDFVGVQEPLTAVATFIAKTPDFIFLDLNMPIVNGYEVCAQIRRVAKLKDIPVVILTGNDGIVDRVRSKVVGASGFLSKPIDQNKIISIVRKMLIASETTDNRSEL